MTYAKPDTDAKRLEPWPVKAKRHGVTTRTLTRWVEQGLINSPKKINGRNYGDPNEEPRADTDAAA
jgi:hypothetical protein